MSLVLKNTKKYGRGVYATRSIKTGEVVETSPVLTIDNWEADRIGSTIFNRYVFEFNDGYKKGTALALGLGSLFNHSKNRNITYKNDLKNKTINFIATRDIKKGEQLFINYGYDIKHAFKVTKANRERTEKNERVK